MIKNFRKVTEHLFRGAALDNRMRTHDIKEMIEENHISLVIDFRDQDKLERYPEQNLYGAKYLSIPLIDFESIGIGDRLVDLINYDGMTPLLFYKKIKNDESTMKRVNYVLNFIENYDYSKGNIYIHCSAGKDRTGIISALILKRQGASIEEIEKDYLKSNKWFIKEAFLYSIKTFFKTHDLEKTKFCFNFFIMKKENIDIFIK